jgi:hypothetical protein
MKEWRMVVVVGRSSSAVDYRVQLLLHVCPGACRAHAPVSAADCRGSEFVAVV